MSDLEIWGIIGGLAVLTFMVRFSFLGLLAGRVLPGWLVTALSFVPVTVLPALVAPAMILGEDGGWAPVPVMVGAVATMAVGILSRSLFGAFFTGMVAYHMAGLAGW
ncbi:MAG: AzlD domain-containing protein [Pseudomonadota bacterium]